jgi:hypothetical protein
MPPIITNSSIMPCGLSRLRFLFTLGNVAGADFADGFVGKIVMDGLECRGPTRSRRHFL